MGRHRGKYDKGADESSHLCKSCDMKARCGPIAGALLDILLDEGPRSASECSGTLPCCSGPPPDTAQEVLSVLTQSKKINSFTAVYFPHTQADPLALR